jgi:hypothetical protein
MGLKHHWGGAYQITQASLFLWVAIRRDDGTPVHAASAAELYVRIREDYEARPVPRGPGPVDT